MVLNPDLKGPYILEQMDAGATPYRKLIKRKMRDKKKPRMSAKYHRKQASEWYKTEKVYHQCVNFDAAARPTACEIEQLLEQETTNRRCISLEISQQSAIEQFDQNMLAQPKYTANVCCSSRG